MATPQTSHQSSHVSRTSITTSSTSTSTSRMNDVPFQLTPSQIEAQKILEHLLSKLKETDSKYYSRYGKWIERHPRLNDFCFRCIRPQVWSYLNGRWSLDALKGIQGDLRSDARSIYLNGVLGLDKNVRIYIGQASSLRPRIAQHLNFRYRRDNPSLHYHAIQNSIYNAIGALAILPSPNMGNHSLPGMDAPDLLLNVMEMWMCLVFRSLPPQVLEKWMPDGVDKGRKEGKEGVFGGLNVRSPLDQGENKPEWVDLSESDDPLVREYIGAGMIKHEQSKEQEEDTVAKRKRVYAEKARKLNQGQKEVGLLGNTLIVFGIGVALGLVLGKGFGTPMQRQ